jgi:uncharacterized protein (TIGR02646 family)
MIRIDKNVEPSIWAEIKKTPGISFESADKKELRRALLEEQGYICGYCMRRINSADSKIEHIKPQSKNPTDTLDYNNLIICCNGDITGANDSKSFHCDTRKAENTISFTPFSQSFIDTLSYSSKDGEIKSSRPKYNEEINNILNLNLSALKSNRLETLKGVVNQLAKKKDWKKSEISSMLLKWASKASDGKLKAYCGIVIWFLTKHLRKK